MYNIPVIQTLLETIPESISLFFLCAVLLGLSGRTVMYRVLCVGAFHAIVCDTIQDILHIQGFTIETAIIFLILLMTGFRLSVHRALLGILITMIIGATLQVLTFWVTSELTSVPLDSLIPNIAISIPLANFSNFMVFLIGEFLRRKGVYIRLFIRDTEGLMKDSFLQILSVLLPIFLGISLILYFTLHNPSSSTLLLGLFAFIDFIIVGTVWVWVQNLRARHEALELASFLANAEELSTEVRGLKHDFLNQLQLLESLASIQDVTRLRNVLSAMIHETSIYLPFIQCENRYLQAILITKSRHFAQRNVTLNVSIADDYREPSIPPLSLIRVLTNLLDNACDAAETAGGEILFDVVSSDTSTTFKIENSSEKTIDLELVRKKGVSTKGGTHSGLGLYITDRLIRKCGGRMFIDNKPGKVQIVAIFPHASGERNEQLHLASSKNADQ